MGQFDKLIAHVMIIASEINANIIKMISHEASLMRFLLFIAVASKSKEHLLSLQEDIASANSLRLYANPDINIAKSVPSF